ncbi:branched-chain amino acid transport system ATP-binding protein [Herbaspirillum sp. Sphag1AN]|uniref:ABC transporter ATP-binding protein n=1 Tax=unclassified Herbaspirillum TaxID=2624150 RepID=UPI0016224B0F|nr:MULTISPECIES: ABC transporter ATP-binding protein [unclassified Herbaspirillum]MBB3214279.1 branched-chain amino acid transport system ATP-binding protein [Herbaspirillum sp. Sphag1AN]MBB3247331.1 branched-chain amino acid transport system ATP-binding protein [Herbaspirillum sp. Sphag64]
MIDINSVVAGYTPEVDILKGMTLQAQPAEIVTLLGPNGCGKSTLLKTIAGFLQPRSGTITLQGKDISTLPAHHKIRHCRIGFVPQTENVFSALTIRENLQVGGHFMSEVDCRARIDELCTLYPILRKKFNTPAASMSGGERQILALARALMPGPSLLLLDEPSAGLSPKVLLEVFEAIQQVRSKEQVTILIVEQNAMEALRISDRAYVLSMGAVALTGSAAELLNNPQVRELYLGGRAA